MADDYLQYLEANQFLDEGLIRRDLPAEENPLSRRQWMERLLPLLGHPERAFPVVHVAGTSGKGSVCVMLAEVLRAAGVRCGLHVSPYLQVSTEKLWVDGRLASGAELRDLVSWVRPSCEALRGPHAPLHGMASVAVALEHFRRQRVELAVVETGVGGRLDLTNVLQTRVAAVTGVGWDHEKTLGPTLEDIAWHKAGIVRAGCRAVVLDGGSPARAAVERQAAAVKAPVRVLGAEAFASNPGDGGCVRLDFRGRRLELRGVDLGMPGWFQAQNAALALAALEELDPGGERVGEDAVRLGLRRARLPGRLEWVPWERTGAAPVLLDGAHNPDKLGALLGALPGEGRRLHLVYGGLASRSPDAAVLGLAGRAASVTVTEPQVYQKAPRPSSQVRAVLGGAGIGADVEPDPLRAVERALNRARPGEAVLVTGSLYLCGQVRGLFYPPEQVVQQRTSWPD